MRRHLSHAFATRTLQLPPLPGVAAEVIASSADDRADAARLAELIQSDQGLAGQVLRVVNSPALRAAVEIVSLRQAVSRLGMNRIGEIALTASLGATLYASQLYASHCRAASQFGLCTALWAKELARTCRRNTEIAYLCGLLHDVGSPVVLNAMGGANPKALPACDIVVLLGEFKIRAGELLAKEWRLPAQVEAAIRCFDDFRSAGDFVDLVAITRCAAFLAERTIGATLVRDDVVALDVTVHLNLYPDDVEQLLASAATIRGLTQSMAA